MHVSTLKHLKTEDVPLICIIKQLIDTYLVTEFVLFFVKLLLLLLQYILWMRNVSHGNVSHEG